MKCSMLIADNQFMLFDKIVSIKNSTFFIQMNINLVTLIHAFHEEQKNSHSVKQCKAKRISFTSAYILISSLSSAKTKQVCIK